MKLFAGAVAPREGQRQQPHHFGQARRVGEVGVLEVEAPRFQATEQGFHLPSVGVSVDRLILGCAKGGEDEQFAVIQAQRREVDEATPDGPPSRQQVRLAGFERAQERVDPHGPIPVVGDERVALDALVEGNPLLLQPTQPRLTHEFAVGQQHGDSLNAKDGKEALHQGSALGGVGIARLAQDAPKQREGNTPIGDTQHQKIDVHPAKPPVGAIQGQPPRAIAHRNQPHQQPRPGIRFNLKRAEEALQPFVVRSNLGSTAKPGGQFGQVDTTHLEQGQKKLRQKPDPGTMPCQVFR